MRKVFFASFISLLGLPALAQGVADTVRRIDEVLVSASSKEQAPLDKLPVAYTSLTAADIERSGMASPNDLSAMVPNFYMPDYGSKLTSAIYIRGIGSRMNESAVGLYVDNAPYLDKSSFDFDFFDLAGVEVLRGPQGTLYGRNAMGGIVNIYTASPLSRQGTRLQASYGNANTLSAVASHARKFGDKLGLSLGGSYNQTDGFFTNDYDGQPTDALKSGAARLRLDWQLTERWRLSYTLSGEYSEQSGYAYGLVDSTGKVHNPNYNDPMGYSRTLVNNGILVQHSGKNYTFSSSTAYQYLDDCMQLDQDFSPADMFMLEQKQRQNALTEELILKSQGNKNYRWLFGAFGFYKGLNTEAPVSFKSGGVAMIQGFLDAAKAANPGMPAITIVDPGNSNLPASSLNIPSEFESQSLGAAVFHQSTYNNLLVDGLSITAGLRLDYEQVALRYKSSAKMYFTMGGGSQLYSRNPVYDDKMSNHFLELLPKVALQYSFGESGYSLYASAAKGYTPGGYNLQMFSDITRSSLQNKSGSARSVAEVEDATYYKPEYSWDYELGARAALLERKLQASATAFYIDTRDQQVAQFVPSGFGRIMRNAARSRSYGAELALAWHVQNFSGQLAYGYTHATFTQYTDSVKPSVGQAYEVSYKGNYVPFAPQHTLSVGAEYSFTFNGKAVDKLTLGAAYSGVGKIYFTEGNDSFASQNFYSLLNAKIAVEKNIFRIGLWGKNLLNAEYKTFYFESMGNGFAQRGRPVQFGVEAVVKF